MESGSRIANGIGSTSPKRDLALHVYQERSGAVSPKRNLALQITRRIWFYKSQQRSVAASSKRDVALHIYQERSDTQVPREIWGNKGVLLYKSHRRLALQVPREILH
jgi:hypothetical protein